MSAHSIVSKILHGQYLGHIPTLRIVILIAASAALYGLLTALYNLILHPLRKVPGPFLARLRIKEAHERYGPVIRIAPNELHFASPTATKKIYTQGKGAPLKAGFYSSAIPIKEQHSFSMVNMFTFESVYLLSFEEPLGMMKTGEEHHLMHLANRTAATLTVSVILPFTRPFLYRIPGRMFNDFRAVHEWKQYYIDRMRALTKSSQSPFLFQLLDTVSEEHNRPLSESEAAEELIGLMFAGSETVGVTMNWLLWELAQNPDVQEKLFMEICEVMPSPTSSVPHDDLVNLPFLKAVIKETLRVHTAILGPFPRVAVEDMVIEGQAVPKGSIINMCTYVTHRDPKYFPDPEHWVPSRWIDGDAEAMKVAFAPFSTGPRVCMGQGLALAELTSLVPTVCRRFKFSLAGDKWSKSDLSPIGAFATRPKVEMNYLKVEDRI
ncbi:hypothetical protein ZTR_09860 [Talaromyces verruculosus]|nr:hypothetical protein ZTR_09860 [Talaromyces verruculosus]